MILKYLAKCTRGVEEVCEEEGEDDEEDMKGDLENLQVWLDARAKEQAAKEQVAAEHPEEPAKETKEPVTPQVADANGEDQGAPKVKKVGAPRALDFIIV